MHVIQCHVNISHLNTQDTSIKLSYFEIDHITLRNTYKVEPELLSTNSAIRNKADYTMLFLTSEEETISG